MTSKLRPSRADLSWLTSRPIAHRGLHDAAGGVPENTLLAFERAIARGLPIECDVALTSDGEAVVFHDQTLARLTGVAGEVERMTLRDMKALRIGDTSESPPSLVETLELVRGRVPLLIELKALGSVGPLETAVLRALRSYSGPVAVQSFSEHSLRWFRKNAPDIPRGQLAGSYRWDRGPGVLRAFIHRHLLVLWISRPDFVAHEVVCLDLPAVRLWRRFGGPLLAWTAKNERDYAEARAMADGVIFEGFDPLRMTPDPGLVTST